MRLLVFFTLSISCLCADYYVAICAMFQNEAPYLKEWIEFHRLLGVEHFYLYNNCSNDDFAEILQPYCKNGVVTLIDWPFFRAGNWYGAQFGAYDHCLKLVKNDVFWLAVIDIDEFIVPVKYNTLIEFLKSYETYGGIEIAWQDFGTSLIEDIPQGKTMLEMLIYKAPRDSLINGNCKTICRPKCVSKIGIHECEYLSKISLGKTNPLSILGGGEDKDPRGIDIIRIQHYWTRTENYFREKKIPRIKRMEERGFTQQKIDWIYKELNSEIDNTVIRFIPELKKKLGY